MKYFVFVYGTLKLGMSNHRCYLQEAVFVGRGTTLAHYRMMDTGGFPVVMDNQSHPVFGEVYEIDGGTLLRLDELEGHPRFFNRKQVQVHVSGLEEPLTCLMYFGAPMYWKQHLGTLKEVPINCVGLYVWGEKPETLAA